MIKKIENNTLIFAIIIKSSFQKKGIEFFTPSDFSQQLGYMQRDKGYTIEPHIHKLQERNVKYTQEVLFIKSGIVRVDFYDNDKIYFSSEILEKGDVILLSGGGHGFKIIEDAEIIEVKQGPYSPEDDKYRFNSINEDNIKIYDSSK